MNSHVEHTHLSKKNEKKIERETKNILENPFLKAFTVLGLLYLFLVGVKSLEMSIKLMGSNYIDGLLTSISNPVMACFSAMLATVLIQSSSATTSIIVGMVASGMLKLDVAVPMVMGANIGTTVTNTLLSMGYLKDRNNFKKAFGASIIHDFFNLLTTMVLLPLEIYTGFLQKTASEIASVFVGSVSSTTEFANPLKNAVDPLATMFKTTAVHIFGDGFGSGIALLVASFVGIILTLTLIVGVTKKVIENNQGEVIERILGKNPYISILFGFVLTVAVQSSSVTTSLIVPLAATGLISLNSVFAVTVGCNIGTTTTALFAALTGNALGLTIAIVHMLFNIVGTLIWFVPRPTRVVPIFLASKVADLTYKNRAFAFIYIIGVFFALPISLIMVMNNN